MSLSVERFLIISLQGKGNFLNDGKILKIDLKTKLMALETQKKENV